jgi:ribose-phosphate pyrophosphokinase
VSSTKLSDVIVVGNSSDEPFAIDVAAGIGQGVDIADLINLKSFANSEFCPRFISDDKDVQRIGSSLAGKIVVIVSASHRALSRQELSMRNLLIARAARENGAARVVLCEPDLFYSAQDRGPRRDLGETRFERDEFDLKKFDGQPFSTRLYAEMLQLAGVDTVITVHNQSYPVERVYSQTFSGRYLNLTPYAIYADYLRNSNILDVGPEGDGLVLCAPDRGARDFVKEMFAALGLPKARIILLDKRRSGERDVSLTLHEESETTFEQISGSDIVLMDDMVRTGSTVVQTCQFLKRVRPRRIVFVVSHFYASDEGRQKLADTAIDEILTLNTMPTVLNRDEQGRLRRKMVVLKIEPWLARKLCEVVGLPALAGDTLYQIDMSSKNPRFVRKIGSNTELPGLRRR